MLSPSGRRVSWPLHLDIDRQQREKRTVVKSGLRLTALESINFTHKFPNHAGFLTRTETGTLHWVSGYRLLRPRKVLSFDSIF